jgi:tetratricopeptide (TPR) repeat protein
MLGSIGDWHVAMGHYDDAIREYQKGIELNPYDSPMHAHLSGIYEAAGRHQEAFEEVRKAYELSNNLWQRVGMAHQLAHLERTAEADEILSATGALMTQTAASFTVAQTYSVLRRREETFRWLQYAFEARASGMLRLRRNPDFEWLRSDKRFQELLSRIDWPQ